MKESVIVLGGGGHSKVVIEILRASGYSVEYCISASEGVQTCVGVPVLCGDHHLDELLDAGYSKVFPGVGSNLVRERAAERALKIGYQLVSAISPAAIISPSATIGRGVAIMGGVVINAESKVEDLAIINTGATVDHDCHIGLGAHVAPRCVLAGSVKIGNGSFLGAGTVVIPEVVIGERCIIGAGAVVVRDVPAFSKAIGHPARIKNKDN